MPKGIFIIGVWSVIGCLAVAGLSAFSNQPLLNPDLGDVVLFVFALAGAISGFIAGYGWRRLRAGKTERRRAAG